MCDLIAATTPINQNQPPSKPNVAAIVGGVAAAGAILAAAARGGRVEERVEAATRRIGRAQGIAQRSVRRLAWAGAPAAAAGVARGRGRRRRWLGDVTAVDFRTRGGDAIPGQRVAVEDAAPLDGERLSRVQRRGTEGKVRAERSGAYLAVGDREELIADVEGSSHLLRGPQRSQQRNGTDAAGRAGRA